MSRPSASTVRIAPRSAFPQARVRVASAWRRVNAPTAGGSAGRGASSLSAAKAVAASSGSKAPSGAMRGRMRLRAPLAESSALASACGGALRRHVDRRVGQRHRSARAGEAVDQDAVQERAAQGRQKRRAGGNREDSGLANGHARLLCGARGKASGRPAHPRKQPRRAAATRSHRPESRTAANPAASANGRARMPAAMSRSKRGARVGFRCEAEQAGPTEDAPAIALEQPVEPRRVLAEAIAHCVRPGEIGERSWFRSRSPDR